MNHTKISFVLLLAFFVCVLASGGVGQGSGPQTHGDYGGQSARGGRQGGFGQGGYGQGLDESQSPGRRQSGGYDSKKYRSNLYSDDDVYGYDATYPNGEAAYINYKSKDARARRGPEFARTSRAYSRQGGGGQGGFGQMSEYKNGGGGGGAGMW